MAKLREFFENDSVEGLRGAAGIRRVAPSTPGRDYVEELNASIAEAMKDGHAVRSPEAGLYYIVMTTDGPEVGEILDRLKLKNPWIIALNEFKNERAWAPYYPFILSIADKDHLWLAAAISARAWTRSPIWPVYRSAELGEDDDLEGYLVGYAVRQLEVVLTPRILQLRRLVIGEVGRFPELGAALYAGGPGRAIASLAATFERLADRGALSVHDPLLAATQFNWLIMSAPLNRTMLLGDGAIPSSKELREHAREGVRMFLAAYSR